MASAMIETLPESKPIINLLTNKNKLETSPIRPGKAPNAVRFSNLRRSIFFHIVEAMLESFYNPYPLFISLKNTIKPLFICIQKTSLSEGDLLFSIAKSQKQEPPKLLC